MRDYEILLKDRSGYIVGKFSGYGESEQDLEAMLAKLREIVTDSRNVPSGAKIEIIWSDLEVFQRSDGSFDLRPEQRQFPVREGEV